MSNNNTIPNIDRERDHHWCCNTHIPPYKHTYENLEARCIAPKKIRSLKDDEKVEEVTYNTITGP